MLFKKKDANDGAKAKTEFNALKAKKADAVEKKDEEQSFPHKGGEKHDAAKTLKLSVAQGRVSPSILRRPRITEKATSVSDFNIYTFDVSTTANKKTIASAVKDVYGITPVRVRTVAIPAKHVMSRKGVHGSTSAGKKAYVYLKKGDTIELV
jgi:large subunit ribosomal protein L23